MTRMEDREAKRALWQKHWQEWSASAEPFAEYARRHELDVDEGYRWKRILQRAGLLAEQLRPIEGDRATQSSKPVEFVRVRVAPVMPGGAVSPLRLELQLANGRRAALTLADEAQLLRIVKLLEQPV